MSVFPPQVMKKILKTLMTVMAAALVTVPSFADKMCFDRHYDAAHLGKHPD